MREAKTQCRVCNAVILQTTADRTGRLCMPCYKIPPRDGRPIDPWRFVKIASKFPCLLDRAPGFFELCDAIAPGNQSLSDDVSLALEDAYAYIEKYRDAEECTADGLALDPITRWMESQSLLGSLDHNFDRGNLVWYADTYLKVNRLDADRVIGPHELTREDALIRLGEYLATFGDELGDFSFGDSYDLFRLPADRMARVAHAFAEIELYPFRVWK